MGNPENNGTSPTEKINQSITKEIQKNSQVINLLDVQPANSWLKIAKELPPDRKLYDEFWLEFEMCFFFGGPGSGKSIHAVQIGIEIAQTEPVLFCDFELSTRQFAKRYRYLADTFYVFPEKFYRAEFQRYTEFDPDTLINSIHLNAKEIGAKILIIDNISWIIDNSEKGDIAGNFMKKLSQMKKDHDYSILIVAHTTKRDTTQPITLYDMAGSMKLQNFIDSSFAVVKSSKMDGYAYIKQTKTRSEEEVYGFENVKVGTIQQGNDGFTRFVWEGTANEMEHLKRPSDNERENIKKQALDFIKSGKSFREIQKLTGLSLGALSKYKKQIENEEPLPF